MGAEFKAITSGTVTSPQGFLAGAVNAGIKGQAKLDMAILCSETPCVAAGVFTTNAITAAPVILSQKPLKDKKARAVVVNSGCANACTGDSGMTDAVEMASSVAGKLGLSTEDVLVASTGVIGVPLPMERLRTGIHEITLSSEGGHQLAKAMMTTDTFPKEIAVSLRLGDKEVSIGGVAKGAGMIHPDMATLLCFLTTDATI